MSQSVAKRKNIDEKRLSILDLNEDCQLEIMKQIIAGCNHMDPSNPSKYADMENFAMAVESTKELLRIYHKEIFYHREVTEVAKERHMRINFSELQSTIAEKNEGDALWKLYANAIRNNKYIEFVILSLDTSSSYPEFPEHFQIVKCALENKKYLTDLVLDFKGYPMDDLSHLFNHFDKLRSLTLDLRMSAETLVSVCRSAPQLSELKIMSADIQGRLSDIVPHCSNLKYLTFVPNPNVDRTEYAPLVELPQLSEITIYGAYKNGLLLSMFQAMKDWRRDENSELTVNFTDVLPPSSSVTMARVNLMNFLRHLLIKSSKEIELMTSYNFFEISRDSRPIEESLVTMNLCAASFRVDLVWKRLILQEFLVSDVYNLIAVLKQLNVNNLTIEILDYKTLFPKLFNSLIPDGLYGLKSICINDNDYNNDTTQLIDQLTIRELVKIKSITFLQCSFADWESVELLSELTNLQTLNIKIKRKFEMKDAKKLFNLLNTCSVCTLIHCYDWIIEFQKNDGIPGPTNNGVNTLKIYVIFDRRSLNELFEALSYRNFNANEELCILNENLKFQTIQKVSEIKTLKKLSIRLFDPNGIETLSELTELEELSITQTKKKSLIKLFDQLASKESSSLQSLKLNLMQLSHNEILMISRIRSLKKLNLFVSDTASFASLTELANSNIEELEISVPRFSLKKLLSAFAERRTTRLRHLKSCSSHLDLMELTELSKLQDLSSLHIQNWSSEILPYLEQLKNLKKLAIPATIFFTKFTGSVNLENLESLTLSSYCAEFLPVLCNIKGLKELIIEETNTSLGSVYKACEDALKLELLNVPIYCFDELEGITRMKSLKKLFIRFTSETYSDPIQPLELGQLTDLEFLYIKTEELEFELWALILKSCKNISICTIDGLLNIDDNFVGKVHTLIKSIRNPAIQDPLLLTVILLIDYEYVDFSVLEYIDDAYLKVYYSFMLSN